MKLMDILKEIKVYRSSGQLQLPEGYTYTSQPETTWGFWQEIIELNPSLKKFWDDIIEFYEYKNWDLNKVEAIPKVFPYTQYPIVRFVAFILYEFQMALYNISGCTSVDIHKDLIKYNFNIDLVVDKIRDNPPRYPYQQYLDNAT